MPCAEGLDDALTQYLVFAGPLRRSCCYSSPSVPGNQPQAWYSLADEWANACPAPAPQLSRSPALQPLLPGPGQVGDAVRSATVWFLHVGNLSRHLGAAGVHAGQPQHPQHIPGGELGMPTCTPGLGFPLWMSLPPLIHLAVLAAALLPRLPPKSHEETSTGTC